MCLNWSGVFVCTYQSCAKFVFSKAKPTHWGCMLKSKCKPSEQRHLNFPFKDICFCTFAGFCVWILRHYSKWEHGVKASSLIYSLLCFPTQNVTGKKTKQCAVWRWRCCCSDSNKRIADHSHWMVMVRICPIDFNCLLWLFLCIHAPSLLCWVQARCQQRMFAVFLQLLKCSSFADVMHSKLWSLQKF